MQSRPTENTKQFYISKTHLNYGNIMPYATQTTKSCPKVTPVVLLSEVIYLVHHLRSINYRIIGVLAIACSLGLAIPIHSICRTCTRQKMNFKAVRGKIPNNIVNAYRTDHRATHSRCMRANVYTMNTYTRECSFRLHRFPMRISRASAYIYIYVLRLAI